MSDWDHLLHRARENRRWGRVADTRRICRWVIHWEWPSMRYTIAEVEGKNPTKEIGRLFIHRVTKVKTPRASWLITTTPTISWQGTEMIGTSWGKAPIIETIRALHERVQAKDAAVRLGGS